MLKKVKFYTSMSRFGQKLALIYIGGVKNVKSGFVEKNF